MNHFCLRHKGNYQHICFWVTVVSHLPATGEMLSLRKKNIISKKISRLKNHRYIFMHRPTALTKIIWRVSSQAVPSSGRPKNRTWKAKKKKKNDLVCKKKTLQLYQRVRLDSLQIYHQIYLYRFRHDVFCY